MAMRTAGQGKQRHERVEVIYVKGGPVRRVVVDHGTAYIYDRMIPVRPTLEWIAGEEEAEEREHKAPTKV